MYLVFARKYRPQTFDDVAGQTPIARTLQNAIRLNRVAHAYLFTGSRGVGKTSMARIMAKALNCEKGPTTDPCCQCRACKSISTGDDVDVIEMDAASNRGIEEIRQLRQNVKYAPSRCRYKVYIIDEAHQLTGPAFNALLKTLEEPPGHVVFILATTDPQKLPETVVARCQRFDFRRISVTDIIERLRQICEKEGVAAQPGALELVARHARGGMRDAQGALDQLCSFGGKEISVEDVRTVLGVISGDALYGLVDAVIAEDAAAALKIVEDAIDRGQEIADFVDQVTNYLRDVLVVQHCGADSGLVEANLLDIEAAQRHAKALSRESLLYIMQLLQGVKNRSRNDPGGRTALELAVLKILHLKDLQNLETLIGILENSGPPPAGSPRPGGGQTPQARRPLSAATISGGGPGRPTAAPQAAPVAAQQPRRNPEITPSPSIGAQASKPSSASAAMVELTAANLPQIKARLIETLKTEGSNMLARYFAGAEIGVEDGRLCVIPAEGPGGEPLTGKESRDKLTAALKRLTGSDYGVRIRSAEDMRAGADSAAPNEQRIRKLQRAARSPGIAREAVQDGQLMRAFEAIDQEFGLEPTDLDKEQPENEQ
ncbi:MAG TPA: DNA polymerase III subunit gamma/tau [Candidatus Brocadiia bacterium]|nr:DNA polymerase III subunit gamma/tau [Candidatus Brocadiia bacterium]